MEYSACLPGQICRICANSIIDFLPFFKLYRESAQHWNEITNHLNKLSVHNKTTTAYVLIDKDGLKTVKDRSAKNKNPKEILRNMRFGLSITKYKEKCKKIPKIKVPKEELIFTCPKCKKNYSDFFKYNTHIANIRMICCEHCNAIVEYEHFGDHLKSHGLESFQCKTCGLHFEEELSMLKHNKCVHKNGSCICPECKKTFPTMNRLTQHTHLRHKTIHCVCNEVFTSKACFSTHKKSCDAKETFVCDYCSKVFRNRSVISAHINFFHNQNKMHVCEKCGKRFSNPHALEDHSYSHDRILDRFTCEFCLKIFSTKGGLRKHMRKKHYSVDPELYKKIRYQCHICDRILISERNLERHLTAKHKGVEEAPDLPRGVCCKCTLDVTNAAYFKMLCQQSAQRWDDAATYFNTIHDPDKKDKTYFIFLEDKNITATSMVVNSATHAALILNYDTDFKKKRKNLCNCPYCSKPFNDIENLNNHLKNTLKSFCWECGVIFNKKDLACHLMDRHSVMVFECKNCYKLFSNNDALKQHRIQNHGPTSHNCQICGNGFSNKRSLAAHDNFHALYTCACGLCFENKKCYKYHMNSCKSMKRIISVDAIYECDYCGVKYDKKYSLKVHIKHKHLNILPFVCHTCGKRASTISHLRSHQNIHEKERKLMECKYCGAKFRSSLGYKLHTRIHTGDRPYKCELCDESFLSASRRLDHVKRRHKNVKEMSHGCDQCSAAFIRPWELKRHYLSVHNSIREVKPRPRALGTQPKHETAET